MPVVVVSLFMSAAIWSGGAPPFPPPELPPLPASEQPGNLGHRATSANPLTPSPTKVHNAPPMAPGTDRLLAPSAREDQLPDLPRANIAVTPETRVLLFAGETIELTLDVPWNVYEVPLGRQWSLVVTPERLPEAPHPGHTGLWVSHLRQAMTAEETSPSSLLQGVRSRLQARTAGRAVPVGEPRSMELDGHPGAIQDFSLPGAEVPTDSANRTAAESQARHGFYILVATGHGMLEMHGIAPLSEFETFRQECGRMLLSLRVRAPQNLPEPAGPVVVETTSLVGTWKALGATMRIHGNGQVDVRLDRLAPLSVPEEHLPTSKPPKRIRGTCSVQGDLMFVEWEDESQLNYRWRLWQGDLLLTDHTGLTSQLKRMFDEPAR